MNLEDERRLKFDRRLRNRRKVVTQQELDAYEASLPDVSTKITTAEGSPDAASPSAPGGAGPATPTS